MYEYRTESPYSEGTFDLIVHVRAEDHDLEQLLDRVIATVVFIAAEGSTQ